MIGVASTPMASIVPGTSPGQHQVGAGDRPPGPIGQGDARKGLGTDDVDVLREVVLVEQRHQAFAHGPNR